MTDESIETEEEFSKPLNEMLEEHYGTNRNRQDQSTREEVSEVENTQ
ncbi:hypothetical protein KGY79_11240 [Candidatus Bipolaricaulota bacterium]|nr:hypothetical protein [Candidatus Bipolaricaulota bacterium]